MKRIEFIIGDNIEKIYNKLQENAPCFGVFNGEKIYSKYTLDEIYLKITGMKKSDYEEHIKERDFYAEVYKLKEYKESIPDIIEYWKERGRDIIPKVHLQVWDNFVPVEIKRYNGFEVFFLLDIIDVLNQKDKTVKDRIEKCVSMFNEKCKNQQSRETIFNWLKYFHPLGCDLIECMKK